MSEMKSHSNQGSIDPIASCFSWASVLKSAVYQAAGMTFNRSGLVNVEVEMLSNKMDFKIYQA